MFPLGWEAASGPACTPRAGEVAPGRVLSRWHKVVPYIPFFLLEELNTSPAAGQPNPPLQGCNSTPPARAWPRRLRPRSPTARVTSARARATRPGLRGWDRPGGLTSRGASLPPSRSTEPRAGCSTPGRACQGRKALTYLDDRIRQAPVPLPAEL